MLKKKYSGINDGKPYPVDMVAFKDGDSVSYLNAENGELKLNGNSVGSGSGGGKFVVTGVLNEETGKQKTDKTASEIYEAFCKGLIPEFHATDPEDSEVYILHLASAKPSLACFVGIGLAGNTENADVLLMGINIYENKGSVLTRNILGVQ